MKTLADSLKRQPTKQKPPPETFVEQSGIHAAARANVASATVSDGKVATIAVWLAVLAVLCAAIALTLAVIAAINTASIVTIAGDAARAAAKAETATARANVSEIYAKQVYTELNRLGYPVKTPAEDHAPQPSDNVSEVPGK